MYVVARKSFDEWNARWSWAMGWQHAWKAGLLAYLALAIIIGKNSGTAERKSYVCEPVQREKWETSTEHSQSSPWSRSSYTSPWSFWSKCLFYCNTSQCSSCIERVFFHFLIHILIWGNVIFYVVATFLFIFRVSLAISTKYHWFFSRLIFEQCKFRQKMGLSKTLAVCHGHDLGIMSGAGNVVTDFLILILPLPILLRLQMPVKRKLRTLSVFAVGLFACIASLVRFVYSFNFTNNQDPVAYQLNLNRQGLVAWVFCEFQLLLFCWHHIFVLNPDLPRSQLESLSVACPPPSSSTGTSPKIPRISTSFPFTAAAAGAVFTGVKSLLDLLRPHPTPIARGESSPLAQTPNPPRLTSQRWIWHVLHSHWKTAIDLHQCRCRYYPLRQLPNRNVRYQ